jgi:hypothetical protein
MSVIVMSMMGRLCEFHSENDCTGSISPMRLIQVDEIPLKT